MSVVSIYLYKVVYSTCMFGDLLETGLKKQVVLVLLMLLTTHTDSRVDTLRFHDRGGV